MTHLVLVDRGRAAPVRQPTAAEPTAADRALTDLYAGHYRGLVRLAALLMRDTAVAEEIVQDSFAAMYQSWRRLGDPDKALAYLRTTVVNRCRSALRHDKVVAANPPRPLPDEPSAEHAALAAVEREEVMAALRALPPRQRETLVLRYYSDLSEAQIAQTLGISRGAVKSHAHRGLAALRALLERMP